MFHRNRDYVKKKMYIKSIIFRVKYLYRGFMNSFIISDIVGKDSQPLYSSLKIARIGIMKIIRNISKNNCSFTTVRFSYKCLHINQYLETYTPAQQECSNFTPSDFHRKSYRADFLLIMPWTEVLYSNSLHHRTKWNSISENAHLTSNWNKWRVLWKVMVGIAPEKYSPSGYHKGGQPFTKRLFDKAVEMNYIRCSAPFHPPVPGYLSGLGTDSMYGTNGCSKDRCTKQPPPSVL